jgi:hypothetical protein
MAGTAGTIITDDGRHGIQTGGDTT